MTCNLISYNKKDNVEKSKCHRFNNSNTKYYTRYSKSPVERPKNSTLSQKRNKNYSFVENAFKNMVESKKVSKSKENQLKNEMDVPKLPTKKNKEINFVTSRSLQDFSLTKVTCFDREPKCSPKPPVSKFKYKVDSSKVSPLEEKANLREIKSNNKKNSNLETSNGRFDVFSLLKNSITLKNASNKYFNKSIVKRKPNKNSLNTNTTINSNKLQEILKKSEPKKETTVSVFSLRSVEGNLNCQLHQISNDTAIPKKVLKTKESVRLSCANRFDRPMDSISKIYQKIIDKARLIKYTYN